MAGLPATKLSTLSATPNGNFTYSSLSNESTGFHQHHRLAERGRQSVRSHLRRIGPNKAGLECARSADPVILREAPDGNPDLDPGTSGVHGCFVSLGIQKRIHTGHQTHNGIKECNLTLLLVADRLPSGDDGAF